MLSDLELAWLAGLLEGEGSFFLRRSTRRPKTKPAWVQLSGTISVGMTDRDVIERVAALLGSRVWTRPSSGKPMYATAITGSFAVELMERLRPHMGARRRAQIDVVVAALS